VCGRKMRREEEEEVEESTCISAMTFSSASVNEMVCFMGMMRQCPVIIRP
jgi:hypothetical protein